MNTKIRRAPYTLEEIKAIVSDRDKHPDMTTLEWAKQYPISEQIYYALKRRLLERKGKVGSPKKTRAQSAPKPKGTEAAFVHALGQIKHWRAEATRLAEQMIRESLTDAAEA